MNRSHSNSLVQLGLLFGALLAGTLLSLSIPSTNEASADEAVDAIQPVAAPASLDHAALLGTFDEITGVDVDMRRLDYVSHIS
jgi:hypothetical protein